MAIQIHNQIDRQRSPFWGLTLGLNTGAQVLVLDDNPDQRREILQPLLASCKVTWVSGLEEAQAVITTNEPFDVYCLDYDLGEVRGGWLPIAGLIRQRDPRSIAKIVLVHSANTEARAYYDYFPAAIMIQWDVLATILGTPLVNNDLIDAVLEDAGPDASEAKLREAALRLGSRSDRDT